MTSPGATLPSDARSSSATLSSNSSWSRGVTITTIPIRNERRELLLVLHPTVRGQKDIKAALGTPQELAVPE
jgi:hypothetical protein